MMNIRRLTNEDLFNIGSFEISDHLKP